MRRQIVIYQAKPEAADENQRLLEKVFEELRARQPSDLRYLSARLGDGTFVHIAFSDDAGGGPTPFANSNPSKPISPASAIASACRRCKAKRPSSAIIVC